MKIQEYLTAVGDTLVELDRNVNKAISEGFQPFGSPYFIGATEGNIDSPICQAMVITEEDAERFLRPRPVVKVKK